MSVKEKNGTLFLITARGGSKGVHLKNLQTIGGLSLIGWKARVAQAVMKYQTEVNSRLIISTDHEEMAREAKTHGVEVLFMRPAELSDDTVQSADVIKHAMDHMVEVEKEKYDAVMLLEPSSPFATMDDMLDAHINLYFKKADLIVGMRETTPHKDYIANKYGDGRCSTITNIITQMHNGYWATNSKTNRQAKLPQWTMNGALYMFRWDMFAMHKNIYHSHDSYGLMMDYWHSIEIDNKHDMEMARYAFDAGHIKLPPDPRFLKGNFPWFS